MKAILLLLLRVAAWRDRTRRGLGCLSLLFFHCGMLLGHAPLASFLIVMKLGGNSTLNALCGQLILRRRCGPISVLHVAYEQIGRLVLCDG